MHLFPAYDMRKAGKKGMSINLGRIRQERSAAEFLLMKKTLMDLTRKTMCNRYWWLPNNLYVEQKNLIGQIGMPALAYQYA